MDLQHLKVYHGEFIFFMEDKDYSKRYSDVNAGLGSRYRSCCCKFL